MASPMERACTPSAMENRRAADASRSQFESLKANPSALAQGLSADYFRRSMMLSVLTGPWLLSWDFKDL